MGIEFDWSDHATPFFFPVTPFAANGSLAVEELRAHIASRLDWRPPGIFVACGTGEFSSLSLSEYQTVVATAVEVAGGRVPVIAGVGYGARLCAEFLERAQDAGADGALVFPPYATAADQHGLVAHYSAVANATTLPIILYQRDHVRLSARSAEELSQVPNIVGLKDGLGNLENLQRIRTTVGDRWMYFNGMPTAELSAGAFAGIGISNYSSATFAFLPEVAVAFARSRQTNDVELRDQLLREFYVPFAALRDRRQGYAVSLIKAGLRYRGIEVGSVRPPLVDPTAQDARDLGILVERGLEVVART